MTAALASALAKPAIPALVTIKREKDDHHAGTDDGPSVLSWLSGKALTGIGPASITELTALSAHESRYVRLTALDALGNMGPQAKDALPVVNKALNDEDELVRRHAQIAIERIEGRRPVSPI